MKVRTRSRLILAAMTFLFLVVLSFVTQFVILDSFNTIEKQEMTANVQRVIANINSQEMAIASTCKDWAGRDETYAFSGEINASPTSGTLNQPVQLGTLDIDYLLIYNTSGKLVFSESSMTPDGIQMVIPDQLETIISNSIIPAGVPGGVSGRRGVSFLNGDPVMLAGYSIQGSNQSNPSRGTLVMARVLTPQRIDDMESILQIPDISLENASSADSTGVSSALDIQQMKKGKIFSQPVNDSRLEGQAMITGIEDKPTFLMLQVRTDRPMYRQVQSSIFIVAMAIILLSLCFILAVQFLLQRFVLEPLSTLDNDIKIIGKSGDLTRRIPEKGDDEVLSLTRALNLMLSEIEKKRNQLSEARRDLALRNRDLEEFNRKANLYLDIYLDVITYEILNAIMGLRGYAEYLEPSASEKEKPFLKKISDLAQKSSNVIRNIETISRIYKMPQGVVPIDLADILKKEIALRPNVNIALEGCNRTVLANDMVGVIFDNLFSNCLKFGGPGVRIDVSARDTGEGMLEISVTDNGPGIPDAMKSQVFDRFAQDSKTRSSYGLGLHIVKMLVEGYGGKVWADDRIHGNLASGAAIRFTLHIAK
jgi:signal transduction histidine kinase